MNKAGREFTCEVFMRGVGERRLRRGWLLPAILTASPFIFLLIILRETLVISGRNWFAKTFIV